MMNKKKELINNTLVIATGMISSQLMSFLLLPIYTLYLSPGDYGITDLIVNYSALLFPIITIQLEMASFRFLVDARNNDAEKKLIISNVLRIVISILAVFVAMYLLLNTFIHIKYTYSILLYACVSVFFYLLLQFARGMGDNKRFAVSYIINGVVTLISTLALVACLRLGVQGMLLSITLANLAGSIYLFYSLKVFNYIGLNNHNVELQKKLVKYSFPLIPDRISWWVITLSDRTIVSIAISVAANGIYAVANKYAAIFSGLFTIFGMSWTESASMHIDDKDRDVFFSETINASIRLFGSLGLILIAYIPLVFNVLINSKFNEAYLYIPILIIAAFFNAIGGLYGAIYIAKKMTKQVARTSIVAAVINIIINLVLIKYIGIYAAAISMMIAYLTLSISRHYGVKKYVNITYDKNILFIIAALYLFTIALYYHNNIIGNIINAIVITVVVVTLNKSIIKVIKDKVLSTNGRKHPKLTIEQEIYEELL